MFNTIRKNQRVLMLIVVILTILAFTFFYTHTGSIEYGRGGVASVYGRAITQVEINRLVENYQLAVMLGLYDLLESLGGTASDESVALNDFVLNQLVLGQEAQALAVAPTNEQVARTIAERPIFQTDGHFDSAKYRKFVEEQMVPRGMNERQLEDLVRDSLQVARIRQIVAGSVAVSDQNILNAFRVYQKQNLQVLKFDFSKYVNKVQITEDQLKSLYAKNSATLNSPETRSVHYVVFEAPTAAKSLQGKARVDALQAVADRAASFAEALSNRQLSFQEAAKQAGLPVATSPAFDPSGSGAAAKDFQGDLPNLARSVFKLTQDHPYSDALEGQNKDRFYVLELLAINSSRPLTLEEARPQLQNTLRNQAAAKLLYDDGQAVIASISEQLHKGKSFQEAAAQAGMPIQEVLGVAPFSAESPENAFYAEAALLLSPGQMSALRPSPYGAFSVFLQKREEVNPEELKEKSTSLKSQLLKNKQTLLFFEWMQNARKAARIQIHRQGA